MKATTPEFQRQLDTGHALARHYGMTLEVKEPFSPVRFVFHKNGNPAFVAHVTTRATGKFHDPFKMALQKNTALIRESRRLGVPAYVFVAYGGTVYRFDCTDANTAPGITINRNDRDKAPEPAVFWMHSRYERVMTL